MLAGAFAAEQVRVGGIEMGFARRSSGAGAVVGESDMSHRAAADALPLRDAFAVLFFVSVCMLFDPAFVLEVPFAVIGVVALTVVAKALVARFGVSAPETDAIAQSLRGRG